MKLADWLEREKRERGLTREEFARRIGRSPSIITQLCEGAAWVSRQTAISIARETNWQVTPNDLLGEVPPEPNETPVQAGA